MAIATRLDRNSNARLMSQVLRHNGSRAAQESERACQHPLVSDRDELGYAGAVAGCQDGNGVTVGGPEQICVAVSGTFLAQLDALSVTSGNGTR
jgi:hypothetical protein